MRMVWLVALLAATATGPTIAAAEGIGEAEYQNACASCHGAAGEGSGPMSDVLTIVVPPLTGLSEANDGVFPMLEVIHIIDGRTGVRGHGSGMPVWGAVMKKEAGDVGDYASEVAARGRVLSIAYYLESIQQ